MNLSLKALVMTGILLLGTLAAAQSTDYNDGLKQAIKSEDAPAVPPKKIVKKKIRKSAAKSLSNKKIAKNLPAKTSKVAQVDDVTSGTTPVREAAPIIPEKIEEPNLGDSASPNRQALNSPPPSYPIIIVQPQGVAQNQTPTADSAAATTASNGNQAQVQPTTNVDSTVVPEPKSEQLRKQREDLERQTESKLIERLEDDRLKSEKDRADRILSPPQPSPAPNAAPSNAAAVVAPVPVVAAPAPAASAAPVPAPAPAPALNAAVGPQPNPAQSPVPVVEVPQPEAAVPAGGAVKAEANKSDAALQGENSTKLEADKDTKASDEKKFSVGASGGIPSYPSASNVSSYFTAGVLASYRFDERFAIQADFDYSKFDIKNSSYCSFCFGQTLVVGMDQYNFDLGLNYIILPSSVITPVVGAVLDFTRRSYSNKVTFGYTYGTPSGSNAFDAGLMAGADLLLSKQIILGFQFKYLWNLSYWTDDPLAYGLYGPLYGSPIESLGYYLATLNLRFLF